jgi:hypothetical protein
MDKVRVKTANKTDLHGLGSCQGGSTPGWHAEDSFKKGSVEN